MTYKPYKMKGSPMKRNFGIGSPAKDIQSWGIKPGGGWEDDWHIKDSHNKAHKAGNNPHKTEQKKKKDTGDKETTPNKHIKLNKDDVMVPHDHGKDPRPKPPKPPRDEGIKRRKKTKWDQKSVPSSPTKQKETYGGRDKKEVKKDLKKHRKNINKATTSKDKAKHSKKYYNTMF